MATDNFHAVLPRLETSRDPLATDEDVDLVFQTRQKGRYFLKTSTEVGAQEGSVVSAIDAGRLNHMTNFLLEYPRPLKK